MKIENEIINFHPQCPFDQLQLDSLQLQYLAHLRAQNTIQDVVALTYKLGWLVDFQKLYELISKLTHNHWILNPNLINYFKNLQIKDNTQQKDIGAVAKKDAKKEKTKYDLKVLQQLPFFRSLKPELSNFLLKNSSVYAFAPQTLICKAGDSSRDLYVLLSGEAAIYKPMPEFRQFISILSISSVFGEAGFFLGKKRTSDILTLKQSQVLVVPYQAEVLDQFLNKEKVQELQQRFWVQHALFHSDLFKKFPSDCLDALTFTGKINKLQDEQILFKQGDLSHAAYIVIQGSLTVLQNGTKINVLAQGSFLGEVSLMVSGGKRTATVCAERNTLVLEIHKNEFYHLLSQNLYLAKEIQLLATKRVQNDLVRANRT